MAPLALLSLSQGEIKRQVQLAPGSDSLLYNSEEVSCPVKPYVRSQVSICRVKSSIPCVPDDLDASGRELLCDFNNIMQLSHDEWGEVCEAGEGFQPYMDTRLSQHVDLYFEFVGDLFNGGMLSFTDDPSEIVTPFFVGKKDGPLRLVWDCRVANRRFRRPPP